MLGHIGEVHEGFNDLEHLDALQLDSRGDGVEPAFCGRVGEDVLVRDVVDGEGKFRVDKIPVPEDGIGECEDGCDAKFAGDGVKGNCNTAGDKETARIFVSRDRVGVEMQNPSEDEMRPLKETDIA